MTQENPKNQETQTPQNSPHLVNPLRVPGCGDLMTVAWLNDRFRRMVFRRPVSGGRVVLSHNVSGLLESNLELFRELVLEVRNFKDFGKDNDPHGEHDFGAVKLEGVKYFWKIDYLDREMEKWCDPMSDDCYRVLTIMEASEY